MKRLELLHSFQPGWDFEQARLNLGHQKTALKMLKKERERLKKMAEFELPFWDRNEPVTGADEVGRGPMAGPLVTAAVTFSSLPFLPYLQDSKKLEAEEREALVPLIQEAAASWAVTTISVPELNGSKTLHYWSLEGMRRSVVATESRPELLLIDGKYPVPDLPYRQSTLIKGDGRSLCIAAASILAKVHRDRLMVELDAQYPGYGFAAHKGYVTQEHREALERLGPCPAHRQNFAPVAEASQLKL